MEYLNYAKKAQLTFICLFIGLTAFSQVDISIVAESDHESWINESPLPLCAGTMTLEFALENSSDVPLNGTFFVNGPTINYPVFHSFTVSSNSCGAGVDVAFVNDEEIDGTFLEFTLDALPPGECDVTVSFQINCDAISGSDAQTIPLYCEALEPLGIEAEVFMLDVLKPTLLLVNFKDHTGEPIDQTSTQRMFIQDDGHRTFDIKCTGGIIESFVLNTELESELEFVKYEFIAFNADGEVYDTESVTLTTEFDVEISTEGDLLDAEGDLPVYIIDETVSAELIDDLFPDGYMKDNEYLEVKEVFNVVRCTQTSISELIDQETFLPDGTNYGIAVGCHDFIACNVKNSYRSISVRRATSHVGHKFSVRAPEPSPPYDTPYTDGFDPMDICGTDASTLSYYYRNNEPNGIPRDEGGGGIAGAGHKRINSISFPLKQDWFTFDETEIYLVNWSSDENTTEVNLTTVGEGVFEFDFESNVWTFNVSEIPDGFQILPFETKYDGDDFFHELPEGAEFSIEFRNVLFDCEAGTFYSSGVGFTDCDQNNNNFMPIQSNSYLFNENYEDMCMIAEQKLGIEPADPHDIDDHYADFYNKVTYNSLTEVVPTDLVEESGSNVATIDFYYFNALGPSAPSPFKFQWHGSGTNFFDDCQDVSYSLLLKVPHILDFDPLDADYYEYFPDPNLFTNGVDPDVSLIDDNEEIDGVSYRVYEITHESIVKEGHLNARLTLNAENCTENEFGTALVKMEVVSHCGGCECPYVVHCADAEVFYHCEGDCCTQISTNENSFSFNRISLGWVENLDNPFETQVDEANGDIPVSEGGISLNRAYTSDAIEVSASGVVLSDATAESCFDPNDPDAPDHDCSFQWCYNIQSLSEIYFMVEYTPNTDFQFFEYIEGTGVFSFTINDVVYDYNVLADDLDGFDETVQPCTLKMYVNDPILIDLIAEHGATNVDFTAHFKVTDQGMMNNPTGSGDITYWQLPQVRGQFAGKYENGVDIFSCDSWGDNMTVIRAGTKTDYEDQGVQESGSTAWSNQQMCGRLFWLHSFQWGGMQSFDEFPNEFRPIMLWPTNSVDDEVIPFTNDDFIEFTSPSQLELVESTLKFRRVSNGVNSTQEAFATNDGSDVKFTGLDETAPNINTWPIQESDEYDNTQMHYYLLARLEATGCLNDGLIDEFQLNFPIIKRAYATYNPDWMDNPDWMEFETIQINEEPEPAQHEFFVINSIEEGQILTLYSSEGIIDNLSLQHSPGGTNWNVRIPNPWLKNLSEDITIESITVSGGPHPDFEAVFNEDYEYWQLAPELDDDPEYPSFLISSNYWLQGTPFNLSIEYSINNVESCDNLELNFDYGYFCSGYEEESEAGCLANNYVLDIETAESDFFMDVSPPDPDTGSPCDEYEFFVEVNGTGEADAENPILGLSLNESFDIEWGVTYTVGEEPVWEPFSMEYLVDCSLNVCNYLVDDLNEIAFDGEGIQGSETFGALNTAYIHFKLKGDCELYDTVQEIIINSNATDICGNDIFDNGIESTVTLDFSTGAPLGDNCESECDIENYCVLLENPGYGFRDQATDVISLEDGKIAVIGDMYRSIGNPDFYLTKMNSDLSFDVLRKSLGESSEDDLHIDRVKSFVRHDGHYYLAGEATNRRTQVTNVFVACIDESDQVCWSKQYGNSRSNIAEKILWLDDNYEELLVIGHTGIGSLSTGSYNLFAMKLDVVDQGDIISIEEYTYLDYNESLLASDAIKLQNENQFVIAGTTVRGDQDIFAFKIDSELAPVGEFSIFGSSTGSIAHQDWASGIVQRGDYLYISGTTTKTGPPQMCVIELYKSDLLGTGVSLIGKYDQGRSESHAITIDHSGNLLLAGRSMSTPNDGLIFSAGISEGENGNELEINWYSATSENQYDVNFNSLTVDNSGQVLIAGSEGISEYDKEMLLLRVDPISGLNCCLDSVNFYERRGFRNSREDERAFSVNWNSYTYGEDADLFDLRFICPSDRSKNIGIENPQSQSPGYKVHPNPNNGTFTVVLDDPEDMLKSIVITDLSGREVLRQQVVDQATLLLNVNHLNSGIYVLQVESDGYRGMSRISIVK